MREILSVDTAYDHVLQSFQAYRSQYYGSGQDFRVTPLTGQDCSRERFLAGCAAVDDEGRPLYKGISISSHGLRGVVYGYEEAGILLESIDDDGVLGLVALQRDIYICACKTADSDLPSRLIDLGANLFAGFTRSPSWQTTPGGQFWCDTDLAFHLALASGEGQPGMEQARLSRIDEARDNLSGTTSAEYSADMSNVLDVLETMVLI